MADYKDVRRISEGLTIQWVYTFDLKKSSNYLLLLLTDQMDPLNPVKNKAKQKDQERKINRNSRTCNLCLPPLTNLWLHKVTIAKFLGELN